MVRARQKQSFRFSWHLNCSYQLDRVGQTIVGALDHAATTIEASYRQPVEMSRRLATQLRAAEERIAELEVKARYHEDRADRAEKWLYQISVKIEQKFLRRDEDTSPLPQADAQNQRRSSRRASPSGSCAWVRTDQFPTTRALQVALSFTEARLRAQGYRVSQFPQAELRAFAEAYLADHREKLVTEASLVVERWREEWFCGKGQTGGLTRRFVNPARRQAVARLSEAAARHTTTGD